MKRAAHCLIAWLAALGPTNAAAQDLRFQRFTTSEGLTDDAVTCLLEDREGFIWIGTERGLARFDGSCMHAVPQLVQHISALAQDRDGAIWIGTTDDGLIRWDGSTLSRFAHAEDDASSLPITRINDLLMLDDSTLVIAGSPVPVVFMHTRRATFTAWEPRLQDGSSAYGPASSGSWWCHAVEPLGEELLWLGMLNNQRSLIMDRRDRSLQRLLLAPAAAGSNATNTCATVLNGILHMVGWQRDVECVQLDATWQPLPSLQTSDEATGLCSWNGRLAVATKRSGLLLFDADGESVGVRWRSGDANSLPTDRVRCVTADIHGNLWVGTANGLAVHSPMVWRMKEEQLATETDPDMEVHALSPLPDGGLQIIGSNGITTMRDGAPIRALSGWSEGAVLTRLSPPMGRDRLLGSETGLLRVDASTLQPIAPFKRGMQGVDLGGYGEQYQVRGVYPETIAGEAAWVVGALGYGIRVFRDRDGELITDVSDTLKGGRIEQAMVRDLVRDHRGGYWCATDAGIVQFTLQLEGVRLASEGGAWEMRHVMSILPLGDTTWAVLREGTLVSIHRGGVDRHRPPHGAVVMRGLAADERGRIWITTDDGLKRYDPRSGSWLDAPVNDGHAHRKLHGPIASLSDGRMAFASGRSILHFDPRGSDALPEAPMPYLLEATSASQSLAPHQGILDLTYRDAALDLRVSAMPTGVPLPCRIRYRLEGAETDWQEAEAGGLIRYAGLPVGEHRLLAKAIDAFGQESEAHALLTVRIAGPFWQQWWFYALAALILSAAAFGWSRYRVAQALKMQAVRNRIASDLHDEVGSSLSSITIGSKLAAQLSTSESAQVIEILARIGETSSQSLRSISDIVWAIDPKNDEGEALVKRMRRIAQELLERKGVVVRFGIGAGVEELKLPMDARKDLLLIFKEAVHNASKHAEAGTVRIELKRANGTLTMRVEDDGKGFDPALHPDGHGLGSMKRRAEAMGGTLELNSVPGGGATVTARARITGIRD